MSDEIRWTVRLPRDLRDRLRRVAERQHRSLNGQLVAAVEDYLRREEDGMTFVDGAVWWNFRTEKANVLTLPVTDDWARDHLPQDERTQAMYEQLRVNGAGPEEALGALLRWWCRPERTQEDKIAVAAQ